MHVQRPVRQHSLGEQVAQELRRLIVIREVAPGTRVTEEGLAGQFGVSRGPVRDALKILASEGLVTIRGRGAEIRGLSAADIDELFSLRGMLESTALRIALETAGETLVAAIAETLDTMEAAAASGSPDAFAAADSDFHSAFFRAAGHSRLQSIWAQYQPSIKLVLLASRETYHDLEPSVRSHYDLAELIRAGEVGPALANLEEHLDNARRRVRSHYEAESPSLRA